MGTTCQDIGKKETIWAKINYKTLAKVVKLNLRGILVETTCGLKVGKECWLSFKLGQSEVVVKGITIACKVSALNEESIFYRTEIILKKFIKGNFKLLNEVFN
jgi:hypothetical protein